jgi:hypothetical protein
MPYTVQFIGMACFFRNGQERLVLMPNGTNSVPPHTARIAVAPTAIVHQENWGTDAVVQKGDFFLTKPCVISLEKADQTDAVHPLKVMNEPISLRSSSPGFTIDPSTAQTIARVAIRQGTLATFRYPGTDDTPDASLITQLDVSHNGNIHIMVRPQTGSNPVRTIELRPGTEIAIVNDSSDKQHDHFHIYQKLGGGPSALGETPGVPVGKYRRSQSHHRVFATLDPIVDGVRCPNTGCC